MWLILTAGLVLLAWAILRIGIIPPHNAETIILIRGGEVIAGRGHLLAHARTSVADIVRTAGIRNGFIAIVPGPRVTFSRSIPPLLHQRLRNVLMNQ